MTIHDTEDTRPVTITHLTKAEIMNAIAFACSLKNGLTGEHNMRVHFDWAPDGELLGADVEQRPAPPGSTGQPPLYRLETNAQRIMRETPQSIKDHVARTLAEAAAGAGGEIATGSK